MNDKLDNVALQLHHTFPLFFKHVFRADQNKIEKGLSRVHNEVLGALSIAAEDGEIISLSELAKRLLISKAYVTALTDKLLEEELIERIPDKNDRRTTNVILTKKGISALNEQKETSISNYKKRLSGLSESDLEKLSLALQNLSEVLSKIKIED